MKEWKLSCYTSVIRCHSGDLLLHNSFMGAIARIHAHQSVAIERFLQQGVKEADLSNQALKELCEGGFFVPSNLDERKVVGEILSKERESISYNLIVLPHEGCNFRCIYCYEKFERGKMRPDVIYGLKAFVNRKVKEYKELKVSWFGGEPLLARDVIYELSDSFIDSCEQNGVTYSSSMTTNGYFLTADTVDALLKRKIKGFQVTLDGPETIHNNNRKLAGGGETYKNILKNLIDMRNRDEEFLVRIRVNFNNASVPLLERWIIDEITPLFANDPRFVLSPEYIGKWGGPNDSTLDVCNPELASPIKFGLIEKSLALGFSDKIAKRFLMSHGNVCYAGRESSIVVGSNGVVYKCTVEFDDPRNAVGRLTSNGQLVINQKLWNMWTQLEGKDTSWCDSCWFFPTCQGRKCPRTAMNENKPLCPMTRREYETLVKLIASVKQ